MNLRSVFSPRSDPKRLDEEHARDGGGDERDEQHVHASQQLPFPVCELNESRELARGRPFARGRADTEAMSARPARLAVLCPRFELFSIDVWPEEKPARLLVVRPKKL